MTRPFSSNPWWCSPRNPTVLTASPQNHHSVTPWPPLKTTERILGHLERLVNAFFAYLESLLLFLGTSGLFFILTYCRELERDIIYI